MKQHVKIVRQPIPDILPFFPRLIGNGPPHHPFLLVAPSPNIHPKACDACVAGGGLGGGQRRCGGEGHNGDDNNDDAAVAADGEDDKRLRR